MKHLRVSVSDHLRMVASHRDNCQSEPNYDRCHLIDTRGVSLEETSLPMLMASCHWQPVSPLHCTIIFCLILIVPQLSFYYFCHAFAVNFSFFCFRDLYIYLGLQLLFFTSLALNYAQQLSIIAPTCVFYYF